MDTLLLKCCLFLVISLLAACATGIAQHQAVEPMLHFQKTPCLGICPSYEATLYTDGRIQYRGYEHTALNDTATFVLDKAELQEISTTLDKLSRTQLRDAYLTQWSDMPSTITTFFENGKEKQRVKHQEGGPEALVQFQEKVHLMLMKLAESEAHRRLPTR